MISPEHLSALEYAAYAAWLKRDRSVVALKERFPSGRGIRYYVLCAGEEWFREFVVLSGLKLQECKYIRAEEDMMGISFSSPYVELIEVEGWAVGRVGSENLLNECFRFIAMYCRDKRVHKVPLVKI